MKNKSHGSKPQGLSPGGIAGVVIAGIVFVGLLVYLYQHHFHYLKRFVTITINTSYNFLPNSGGSHDKHDAESGEGDVNMFGMRRGNFPHQYTTSRDHDDNELETSNPMIDESVMIVTTRSYSTASAPTSNGEQSPTFQSGRKHMDSIDSDSGLFTTNPLQSHPNMEGEEEYEAEKVQIQSSTNIAKSGYLLKQSTGMKWLRRFFFIKDNILYYSKKSTDFQSSKAIPAVLVANLVISTVKEHTNPDNSLEFQIISPGKRGIGTGGGIYCLQAENETDYYDWISIVKQCIAGSLSNNLAIHSSASAGNNHHSSSNIVNTDDGVSPIEMVNPTPQQIQRLIQFNSSCADCGAKYPDWASLNLAVLICIDCSGVHRSLGSHISKVRSLKLDKWSKVLMDTFQVIGNDNANKIWEGQLPGGSASSSGAGSNRGSSSSQGMKVFPKDSPTRDAFIRSKYADKRYILSPSSAIAFNRKQFEYDFLLATYKQDYLLVYKCLVQGVDIDCIVTAKDFPSINSGHHSPSPTSAISSNAITNKLGPSGTGGGNNYHDPKLFDHSALMLATIGGNLLIIELLLNWGANVEVKNSKGFTACDYATQKQHQDANELLSSSSTKMRR